MRGRRIVLAFAAVMSVAVVHSLRAVGQPAVTDKPDVRALWQRQVDVARRALDHIEQGRAAGTADVEMLEERGEWAKRLFEAEFALAADDPARVAAASRLVDAARDDVTRSERLYKAGVLKSTRFLLAQYQLADAERRLAELTPR